MPATIPVITQIDDSPFACHGSKIAVLTSAKSIISAGIHNAIPVKLFFSTLFLLVEKLKAVARVMPNLDVGYSFRYGYFGWYIMIYLKISQSIRVLFVESSICMTGHSESDI